MFENVRADMRMYDTEGGWHAHLGFFITATYRFGHWARKLRARPLRLGARAAHAALASPWRLFRCVYLPAAAELGPGLRLIHPQSILIAPTTRIGARCSLYQEVTLGSGPVPGSPRVGDDVMIFPGARLLGGITVGARVHVGANAVVARDVPDGATVAPQPAQIMPERMVDLVRRTAARP